jgi:hypothetical protein
MTCDTCVIKIFPSPILIKNSSQSHSPVVCVFDYTDLGKYIFLQAIGFQGEQILFQKSECILKTPQVTWRTIYCFLWGVIRLLRPDILLTEKALHNKAYTQLFTEYEVSCFQVSFKETNLTTIMQYLKDAHIMLLRQSMYEVKRVDINSMKGVKNEKAQVV